MKARIIQEPRCVLLWRFDEKSAGYDALAHAARAYKLKIQLHRGRRPGRQGGRPVPGAALPCLCAAH